jgi:hypothetical protein
VFFSITDRQGLRRGHFTSVTDLTAAIGRSPGVGTSPASPLPGPSPPTRSSPAEPVKPPQRPSTRAINAPSGQRDLIREPPASHCGLVSGNRALQD